jgi:hypothetical protein
MFGVRKIKLIKRKKNPKLPIEMLQGFRPPSDPA